MIFTIILVCLTILAIAGGCIWEIERIAIRDYELDKMKLENERIKLERLKIMAISAKLIHALGKENRWNNGKLTEMVSKHTAI